MGEITVTFDPENIDDKMDFMRYVKSLDMACVLFEMQYNVPKRLKEATLEDTPLRENRNGEMKYKDYTEGYLDGVDDIMEKFNNLLDDNNINIEEIIV